MSSPVKIFYPSTWQLIALETELRSSLIDFYDFIFHFSADSFLKVSAVRKFHNKYHNGSHEAFVTFFETCQNDVLWNKMYTDFSLCSKTGDK